MNFDNFLNFGYFNVYGLLKLIGFIILLWKFNEMLFLHFYYKKYQHVNHMKIGKENKEW